MNDDGDDDAYDDDDTDDGATLLCVVRPPDARRDNKPVHTAHARLYLARLRRAGGSVARGPSQGSDLFSRFRARLWVCAAVFCFISVSVWNH